MPEKEKEIVYSEILKNKHFLQFASIIATCSSKEFRKVYVKFPGNILLENIIRSNNNLNGQDNTRDALIIAWTKYFSVAVDATLKKTRGNYRITYSTDDLNWFLSLFDEWHYEKVKAIISLLLAYSSAPHVYYGVRAVASATGESMQNWRLKCERGEVSGAYKPEGADYWLIPELTLSAFGIRIEKPEEEEEE